MQHVMTNNDMQRLAPSIFATQPWERMSDRYGFVPTIEVIDMLRREDHAVTRVMQSRTRIPGKGDFTRHMVRMRHLSHVETPGSEVPEIVIVNSHDGSSSYRFMAGVFRVVCSNGMIIQSLDVGSLAIKHLGDSDFCSQVLGFSRQVSEQAPVIMGRIDRWKGIELTQPQQEAMASAALELRDNNTLSPWQVLGARRQADRSPDLWTTTNRIQESLIRGGIPSRNAAGRRFTTKPIKSVDSDVKLNRALWTLAEKMAELAA